MPSVGRHRSYAPALYNKKSNDHPTLKPSSNAKTSNHPPSGHPDHPKWKQSLNLLIISPWFQLFLGAHESQKEVSRNNLGKGWRAKRGRAPHYSSARTTVLLPLTYIRDHLTIPFKKGKTSKPIMCSEISLLLDHLSQISQMVSI